MIPLPAEIKALFLFASADLGLQPLLQLAQTNRDFYHVFQTNNARLLDRVLVAETSSALSYRHALLLASLPTIRKSVDVSCLKHMLATILESSFKPDLPVLKSAIIHYHRIQIFSKGEEFQWSIRAHLGADLLAEDLHEISIQSSFFFVLGHVIGIPQGGDILHWVDFNRSSLDAIFDALSFESSDAAKIRQLAMRNTIWRCWYHAFHSDLVYILRIRRTKHVLKRVAWKLKDYDRGTDGISPFAEHLVWMVRHIPPMEDWTDIATLVRNRKSEEVAVGLDSIQLTTLGKYIASSSRARNGPGGLFCPFQYVGPGSPVYHKDPLGLLLLQISP